MGNRAGSQDLIELGNRIRDRRNEISMSQEKVAEQAGISANTVSRIEGGQSAMSIEIFIKMVQILGVDANELLGVNSQTEGDGQCRKMAGNGKPDRIYVRTVDKAGDSGRNIRDSIGKAEICHSKILPAGRNTGADFKRIRHQPTGGILSDFPGNPLYP